MNKEKNTFINDKVHDVPIDGNCLFWATMLAYLEPIKTDNEEFKSRYIKLFGNDDNYEKIFNFSNFDFENNKNLVLLFRNNVVKYMKKNKNNFQNFNIDEDNNFDKYLTNMKKDGFWGDELVIKAISDLLKTKIYVNKYENNKFLFSKTYLNSESSNNSYENEIKIIHINSNHYQYYLSNQVKINNNQFQNLINNQPITIINAISPLSINSENDNEELKSLKTSNKKYESVKQNNKKLNYEIKEINKKLKTTKKDNKNLKYEINDLNENLKSEKQNNKKLKSEIDDLNESLKSQKQNNKKLKYEIDDLNEDLKSEKQDNKNLKSEIDDLKYENFNNYRLDLEFNLLLKENQELNEKINSRDEVIQQYLNEQQNQLKENQELNEKINSRDEVIQQYLNEQQNQLKENQHSNINNNDFTLKKILESDSHWKDIKKMKNQLEEVNKENKKLKKENEELKKNSPFPDLSPNTINNLLNIDGQYQSLTNEYKSNSL